MRLLRQRPRLASLALVLLLGIAGVSAVLAQDERFGRKLDELARSLGFTGEDKLVERFARSVLAGSSSLRPTVLQFGLDDRLYVAQQDGLIKAYTIARDGPRAYRATATETIPLVRHLPNHDDDGRPNPRVRGRQVTGMVVAGTGAAPVLYVSSSDPRIGGGDRSDTNLDTNSGVISRLTRVDGAWRRRDLMRGLPRSEELHSTNGLALSADGGTLYVAQGGNTNAGAPSHRFARLPQYALAGAVLAVDLAAIGETTYDLPTLDDDTRPGSVDRGDPFGGNDGKNQARFVPGAPVDLYATGFRNPYDLVLTESGRLLTIDNGMNEGWGGPTCRRRYGPLHERGAGAGRRRQGRPAPDSRPGLLRRQPEPDAREPRERLQRGPAVARPRREPGRV